MATAQLLYGSATDLLTTALNSLANSTTVGYASAEVDNTTDLFEDVLVTVEAQMATSGTPTGFVEAYLLASIDGTEYGGDVSGYTGAAAAYTLGAAGSHNLVQLGVIKPHANTATYRAVFSIAQALGSVPPFWAIVLVNNSGIALHTSGSTVRYRGVKRTVA